ncbi:hypothetical protein [Blautia sp. AM47-4]|uniref:hypothetical protein n=1 Tax=Blautia sp. AM47-4 TaxID=2292979 RepID=UPI000E5D8493|nr:hypothetical protein [Blautia sp. AM47-4]
MVFLELIWEIKKRHIGVQITSTKTSKKIIDSLDTIVDNKVDNEFNEIYFLILGRKQKSYAVDFSKYSTLDCSENNIWDILDIGEWCAHYDAVHMEQVWNVIQREIAVGDSKPIISLEVKKNIFELKTVVHMILEMASQLKQTHYTVDNHVDEIENILGKLDEVFSYLDENTYLVCKEILEEGLELGNIVKRYQKWEWKIEARCIRILDRSLIEKNLQEVSELVSNNILGMKNGVDIIIDGDSLFDRLIALQIDQDILYKQFSVTKFQKIVERSIMRNSKKCIIAFSKDIGQYNDELISRLESEGTKVRSFENRTQTIEFLSEQLRGKIELTLISSRGDILRKVSSDRDQCYLYTVSFKNDLPSHFMPVFFSKGDISEIELNNCFNYKECKIVNIKDITESIYKDMIANANDCISHQLRVGWSGDVYISTITGAEEIEDVKFRWESWDAGNGYTGPRAASDHEYIKQSVKSLKQCWEDGVRGYCDYYAII